MDVDAAVVVLPATSKQTLRQLVLDRNPTIDTKWRFQQVELSRGQLERRAALGGAP